MRTKRNLKNVLSRILATNMSYRSALSGRGRGNFNHRNSHINQTNPHKSPAHNAHSNQNNHNVHSAHFKPMTPTMYPLPCKSSKRWQEIVLVLSRHINDQPQLFKALYDISSEKQRRTLSLRGLQPFLLQCMTASEKERFYQITLPFIQECALKLPSLFENNEVPLLTEGHAGCVELSEERIAALLAMSFFGFHSWERPMSFPRFRITNLFSYANAVQMEKLKCILHYFYVLAVEHKNQRNTTTSTSPSRMISIHRHIPTDIEYRMLNNTYLNENVTPLCSFEFHLRGTIEDCDNAIQIDFANKFIGGGVLTKGCVQEEIRFLINPECLASLLLCQQMKPHEAIAIVGTKQFAKYTGYGSSFEFAANHNDTTPTHEYGDGARYKVRNCIVAIDAEKYFSNNLSEQYKENKMKRELLKCYTGFSIPTKVTNLVECKENDHKLVVATGNWGCGVFGGDIELKCIIQWMAASLAERQIKYFAFGDTGCKYIESFVDIMVQNGVCVGRLWQLLMMYSNYRQAQTQCARQNTTAVIPLFRFIVNWINHNNKSNHVQRPQYVLQANAELEPEQTKVDVVHVRPPVQTKTEVANKSKTSDKKAMKQTTIYQFFHKKKIEVVVAKTDGQSQGTSQTLLRNESFDETMSDVNESEHKKKDTAFKSDGQNCDDSTVADKTSAKDEEDDMDFELI